MMNKKKLIKICNGVNLNSFVNINLQICLLTNIVNIKLFLTNITYKLKIKYLQIVIKVDILDKHASFLTKRCLGLIAFFVTTIVRVIVSKM